MGVQRVAKICFEDGNVLEHDTVNALGALTDRMIFFPVRIHADEVLRHERRVEREGGGAGYGICGDVILKRAFIHVRFLARAVLEQ